MRRFLLFALLAATVPPLAAAADPATAHVWVFDRSPLVVRGTGFAPHERVVVTVSARRRYARTLAATSTGSFVSSWSGSVTAKSGCLGIFVKAVGSRGTVATYKAAGPGCAPGPASTGQ